MAIIASEHYFTANDGLAGAANDERVRKQPEHPVALLTLCVLVMDDGATVVGTHQGQLDGYDAQHAREAARAAAVAAMP